MAKKKAPTISKAVLYRLMRKADGDWDMLMWLVAEYFDRQEV